MAEHKQFCLKINGDKAVKLECGFIESKIFFQQIPVPFKIYVDFERLLKGVKSKEVFDTEECQEHIRCSFPYKLVGVDNKFSKPTVICRDGSAAYRFIEAIVKEYEYCRKGLLKQFLKSMNTLKKK